SVPTSLLPPLPLPEGLPPWYTGGRALSADSVSQPGRRPPSPRRPFPLPGAAAHARPPSSPGSSRRRRSRGGCWRRQRSGPGQLQTLTSCARCCPAPPSVGIRFRPRTRPTQQPHSSHASPQSRSLTPFLAVLVVLALGPVHVLYQRFLRNLVGHH